MISATAPYSRFDEKLTQGLESAKWLAVLLMLLSHSGMAFGGDVSWPAFWLGRVCAPIFGFIIVARVFEKPEGRPFRYLVRLLAWSIPAQVPFYFWTRPFGFHLNEMINLALGVIAIWLWIKDRRLTASLFSIGLLVAAGWFDLGLVAAPIMLSGYVLYQRSPLAAIIAISVGYAAAHLYVRPHDLLAPALCMATPLTVALCGVWSGRLVRIPGWFFYAFYPAHLALIFLIFGPCPPMES